ncbi:MAG: methyltransferase domain-containing protein [Acidobacteria bacterium]|nr:methyltransferase domain-containing protein [Acidobacteriota bacterium]MBI3656767.1 methyltransferase domain-containing protein [Acidobacteriota bacterium]
MRTKKQILGATLLILAFGVTVVVSQENRPPRKPGHLFPAERVEQLEAGERDVWQRPTEIMNALNIKDGDTVADIGAGGGYFTVKLARWVGERGTVYACDIQKKLIDHIVQRIAKENLKNVKTILGEPADPKLPRHSIDAALIVDVYHEVADSVAWLRAIKAGLKPTGRVAIVDFKKGLKEGPGPPDRDRLEEDVIIAEAQKAGLKLLRRETSFPYQYMLIFGKE